MMRSPVSRAHLFTEEVRGINDSSRQSSRYLHSSDVDVTGKEDSASGMVGRKYGGISA
jgi:hypothetical protein